jgi:hypothetical protein
MKTANIKFQNELTLRTAVRLYEDNELFDMVINRLNEDKEEFGNVPCYNPVATLYEFLEMFISVTPDIGLDYIRYDINNGNKINWSQVYDFIYL